MPRLGMPSILLYVILEIVLTFTQKCRSFYRFPKENISHERQGWQR